MNKGLIQVDGKFYKKCKVVMLPTEKASYIAIWHKENKLMFHPSKYNKTKTATPQHLYILSDEEIKGGDWFLKYGVEVCQAVGNVNLQTLKEHNGFEKIIATTDTELTIDYGIVIGKQNLPKSSDAFLKAYCEKGGIDEVLVEYESSVKIGDQVINNNLGQMGIISQINTDLGQITVNFPYSSIVHTKKSLLALNPNLCFNYTLKVAPDNTITIKPLKESWNREEIEDRIKRAVIDWEKMKEKGANFWEDYPNWIDKWIEENL